MAAATAASATAVSPAVTRMTGHTPPRSASASNNAARANSFPKNPGRDPFAISSTGWYTFEHHFYENAGLLAVERHDPETGQRVLAVFNTGEKPLTRSVEVSYRARAITPLTGTCPASLAAPGAVTITLPAFGFAACILETDD